MKKTHLLGLAALAAVGISVFAASEEKKPAAQSTSPQEGKSIFKRISTAFQKEPAKKVMPKRPTPMVSVDQVAMLEDTACKKYVGKIKAVEDASLIARVSGIVMAQKVLHGAFVEKGQVLIEIEDTSYKAKVMSAKGVVAQYEAELTYAKSNYERQKTLKGQNAVAQSAYEEALRLLETTKAKLQQANADLITAEENLYYTKVRAPFKGRMGKGLFCPGNYVTPTSGTLAVVVSLDPVYVDFAISERDYLTDFGGLAELHAQGAPRLELSNGQKYPHEGVITFVDNKVDTDTDTIIVRGRFKNQDYKLIPGGLATVNLGKKNAGSLPAVPLSAVLAGNNGSYVYVVDPATNTVTPRPVKLGSVIGSMQLIASGLKAGESVVTDGTNKVYPGASIIPVQAKKGR